MDKPTKKQIDLINIFLNNGSKYYNYLKQLSLKTKKDYQEAISQALETQKYLNKLQSNKCYDSDTESGYGYKPYN